MHLVVEGTCILHAKGTEDDTLLNMTLGKAVKLAFMLQEDIFICISLTAYMKAQTHKKLQKEK